MKPSARSLIRDVMRGRGYLSPSQICLLLGAESESDKRKVYHQVGAMFREGVMSRIGSGNKMKYAVEREPVAVIRLESEERKARRTEMERLRKQRQRRAAGVKPWGEYMAQRKANAKPKEVKPPRVPKASKSRPANQPPSVYRVLPSLPQVEKVRLMSSTEWGGPIQRLEPWEVSKPLRITREAVRRMAA